MNQQQGVLVTDSQSLEEAVRRGGLISIKYREEPYIVNHLAFRKPTRLVGNGATIRVPEASSDPQTSFALALYAPTKIEDLHIQAGGSYAAISVRASGCEIIDVSCFDYSYKGIRVVVEDPKGTFSATRCYAESSRGNGIKEREDGRVNPLAFQVDPGAKHQMGKATFTDCVAGPHPNSVESGQGIKLAGVSHAIVQRFSVKGDHDPVNSYTLLVAEKIDRLEVKDCKLPRGIAHVPDPTVDLKRHAVGEMMVTDTVLGSEHTLVDVHRRIRATRLTYRNVTVQGIDRAALSDVTKGLAWRRFEQTTFSKREQRTKPIAPVIYKVETGTQFTIEWTDVRSSASNAGQFKWISIASAD